MSKLKRLVAAILQIRITPKKTVATHTNMEDYWKHIGREDMD